MNINDRHTVARLYYYGTPLFILLDYLCGINVRVAVLDSLPLYKSFYYAFCIICGFGIYFSPRHSAYIALFESTTNFLMTILVVFIPYVQCIIQMEDVLNANWQFPDTLNVQRVMNLFIAGLISVYAIHASIRKLSTASTSTKQTSKHPTNSDVV